MKVHVMCKKRVSDSAVLTYPLTANKPTLENARAELIDFHNFWKTTSGTLPTFENHFGFSIEQCVDPDSQYYILDKIVQHFKKCHDWGVAIVEVMSARAADYNSGPLHVNDLLCDIKKQYSFDAPTLLLMRNCIEFACEEAVDTTDLQEKLIVLFDGLLPVDLIRRVHFCDCVRE